MKKNLLAAIITLSVFPVTSFANDNILVHDKGAVLKLGDLNNATYYGLEVASNAENKASSFASNSTTAAVQLGSESEAGFAYNQKLNENLDAKFKLLYRNDVNNTLGASDGAAMIRFNYKFN